MPIDAGGGRRIPPSITRTTQRRPRRTRRYQQTIRPSNRSVGPESATSRGAARTSGLTTAKQAVQQVQATQAKAQTPKTPSPHPLKTATDELHALQRKAEQDLQRGPKPQEEPQHYAARLEDHARKIDLQTTRVEKKAAKQQRVGKTLSPGMKGPTRESLLPRLALVALQKGPKHQEQRFAHQHKAVQQGRAAVQTLRDTAKEVRNPDSAAGVQIGPVHLSPLDIATALIPVGGAESLSAKLAGRPLAELGARVLTRGAAKKGAEEAATRVSTRVAEKVAPKTTERVTEAFRGAKAAKARAGAKVAERTPKPVRVAARGTAKTARIANTPLRIAGRHPGKTVLAADVALGTAAAVKTKKPKSFFAAPVGFGKAITEHPGETALTTVKGVPSLVTAQAGAIANLGLTGGRAASEIAHELHIPGAAGYSGKEITAPTKETVKALADYAKGLVKTYGSGDVKKIEEATAKEYGLWPIAIAGIPGAAGKGRLGKRIVEKIPAARRAAEGHAMRRHEARAKEILSTHIQREETRATHPIRTPMERVKGSARATHNRHPHIQPGDTTHLMIREGISLNPAKAGKQIEAIQKKYAERPDVNATSKPPHDVINYLADNYTRLFKDKKYREAIQNARKIAEPTDTHVRKQHMDQAFTYGVKLPEERFLSERKAAAKLGPKKSPQRIAAEAAIEKKATAAFEKDIATARAKHGLEPAHYAKDISILRQEAGHPVSNIPGGERTSFKQHKSEAELAKAGIQDQSFETYLEHSVRLPRRQRIIHGDTQRFVREHPIEVPIKVGEKTVYRKAVNTTEYTQGVRDGVIDPEKVMLFDSQHWNQAIRDRHASPEDIALSFQEATDQQRILADMNDPSHKGKKYLLKPRAAMEEFIAQRTPRGEKLPEKIARVPSQLILGYSPSWLIAQPIAEGLPSVLSVNPVSQMLGTLKARGVPRDVRSQLASHLGSTAGTGWRGDIKPMAGLGRKGNVELPMLQRSRTGRVLWDLLTGKGARKIDQFKGGKIREWQGLGKLHRDLQGPVKRMGRSMGLLEQLDSEIRGKPFDEQVRIISKRPAEMEKLGNYLIDTSGDWTSIIRSGHFNEAKLSQALIFYPFLRYSVTWYSRFSRQHPVKSAALAFMANQNEQFLQDHYPGGNPSFFTGWASAPLYAGTGKNLGQPTSLLPFYRAAPGANALVEAVGANTGPGGLLAIANPWAAGIYNAASGRNPLSGRAYDQAPVTWAGASRTLAGTVLQWPAILRAIDMAFGKKFSRDILKRPVTPNSQLFDVLTGIATNPIDQAMKSLFLPFAPQNLTRQKQLAEIGRLLAKKYGAGDFQDTIGAAHDAIKNGDTEKATLLAAKVLRSIAADKELTHLFNRYGIGQHKELSAVYKLAGALTGEGTYPISPQDIVKELQDAGVPIPANLPWSPRRGMDQANQGGPGPKEIARESKAIPASPPAAKNAAKATPVTAGKKATKGQHAQASAKALGRQLAAAGLDPAKVQAIARSARKFGIPPEVLASIGNIETTNGTSDLPGVKSGTNSAGAAGPFQFIEGSWNTVAKQLWGKNAGRHSVYNYDDAALAAGQYLRNAGWKTGDSAAEQKAVFSYNHSTDYVNSVLQGANNYRSPEWNPVMMGGKLGRTAPVKTPYTFFLPKGAKFSSGRTDMGWDVDGSPGTPVVAMGNGVVTGVTGSASGFGGYVTYRLTSGPLAGHSIFYGHAEPLVQVGQRLKKGQPVSRLSSGQFTGTGGPGHLEAGFAGRTPLTTLAVQKGTEGVKDAPGGTPQGRQFKGFAQQTGRGVFQGPMPQGGGFGSGGSFGGSIGGGGFGSTPNAGGGTTSTGKTSQMTPLQLLKLVQSRDITSQLLKGVPGQTAPQTEAGLATALRALASTRKRVLSGS